MTVACPEVELLLCCAQTCNESEKAARLKALLQGEIDWAYLLWAADEHGMMPLLFWCLNATCPEAVPKVTLSHLRGLFHDNARRNLFLTGELLKILKLLEAHGIPAIPFKGPTLAAFAYRNLALRQFGDLDILVRERDIPTAKGLLISLGYQQQSSLSRAQEAAFLHSEKHYVFERNDGRSRVELHWSLVTRSDACRLDSEYLWVHLERVSLGGSSVWTLSPEDLLLILCVHGWRHHWERLSLIYDVAKVICVHERMEWEHLAKRAGTQGIERTLFLGLFLANDLLGATLPEEILQRVQGDPTVEALAKEGRERLLGKVDGQRGDSGNIGNIIRVHTSYLKEREHLGDRIRFSVLAALTPNERDWMLLQLPTSLWRLYYVLRVARLTGKYGRKLLRRYLR